MSIVTSTVKWNLSNRNFNVWTESANYDFLRSVPATSIQRERFHVQPCVQRTTKMSWLVFRAPGKMDGHDGAPAGRRSDRRPGEQRQHLNSPVHGLTLNVTRDSMHGITNAITMPENLLIMPRAAIHIRITIPELINGTFERLWCRSLFTKYFKYSQTLCPLSERLMASSWPKYAALRGAYYIA